MRPSDSSVNGCASGQVGPAQRAMAAVNAVKSCVDVAAACGDEPGQDSLAVKRSASVLPLDFFAVL